GAPDADVVDAGAADAGRDASAPDASPRDGGAVDAGPADSGVDAGPAAPAILNPGWIGGPCTTNADCAFMGGTCMPNAAGWPGGTCTQTCTQFCPDQSGPLNSVTFCIDDGNGDSNGQCVSRCDFTLSPTGCRDGYVCLPEKRFNQPSVVRAACVPVAGVPGRATPAFDIGDPCASASDCNRNTCLTDLPGGYCTQESCDVVGCPAGSQCFALGLEGFSACLKTCVGSSDCRTAESYGCDSDNTCWYVPPPAGTCNLAGAAADCAAYASMATPSFVVVTKSLRRMAHCSGSTMLGAYCVGLGSSPVLDKEREGDRRTPEGVFYIPRKIPNSQFYKAFLISYPDSADAARGLAAGLITQAEHDAIVAAQNGRREPPQNTALGGLIEIHGNGSGSDWTWGCIATEDSVIDLLWPDLDVGDTVVVLH
ncbi:L,D-transpeptidase family protein, partial [Myxococcota bacterium]|nr:L,D-transpeptidase family protein [Myxococcota bacterium]